MPIMSYEEFAESIRQFLISKSSGEDIFFLFVLAGILLILLAAFVIYLRRKYIYEKKTVDNFNTDNIKGDFNYPGFHKGLERDEYPKQDKSGKADRKDKWGKIDDD